jgi:hypothetical protein
VRTVHPKAFYTDFVKDFILDTHSHEAVDEDPLGALTMDPLGALLGNDDDADDAAGGGGGGDGAGSAGARKASNLAWDTYVVRDHFSVERRAMLLASWLQSE